MKKSVNLIPQIQSASTREEAISVLNEMLSSLYLTNEYVENAAIKDKLESYKKDFRELTDKYKKLGEVKKYIDVNNIRRDINFLYRDVVDNIVFDINRLKIYYEEYKTVQRATSMTTLKANENFQSKIKATSTSALRDIVGADEEYNEYVSNTSITYGMYKELSEFLNLMQQFVNTITSEEKYLLNIERIDVR